MEPEPLALDFDPLHTLGFLRTDWIEAHCRVPGGVYEGEPLDFQRLAAVLLGEPPPDQAGRGRRPSPAAGTVPLPPLGHRRPAEVRKVAVGRWRVAVRRGRPVPVRRLGQGRRGVHVPRSRLRLRLGVRVPDRRGDGRPATQVAAGAARAAPSRRRSNVYEPLQTMIHSGPLAEFVQVREGFIRAPEPGQDRPTVVGGEVEAGAAPDRRPRRRVRPLHVIEQGARHLADDAPRHRGHAGPHDRAHEPVGPDGELGGTAGVRVAQHPTSSATTASRRSSWTTRRSATATRSTSTSTRTRRGSTRPASTLRLTSWSRPTPRRPSGSSATVWCRASAPS